MKKGPAKERIASIDALRGLAVLLMLEQHLGFWLWDMGGREGLINQALWDNLLMVGFNGLGGLAAPLFIILAGIGATLYHERAEYRSAVLVRRGLVIFLFGYLLNLLALDWFTAGSWYVLHLLGFALMAAPLLLRLPSGALLSLAAVFILGAVPLQLFLGTPLLLDDNSMTDYHRPWGVLRLALAEGHFPVFPWLALFITGIPLGRWLRSGRIKPVISLAAAAAVTAALLSVLYYLAPQLSRGHALERLFYPAPTFYPALPPLILSLLAAAAATTAFFVSMNPRLLVWLIPPGRCSLTILLLHIAFLSGLSRPLGFWKLYSAPATLAITATVLAITVILAGLWRRKGYRYGAEWLVRKIAG